MHPGTKLHEEHKQFIAKGLAAWWTYDEIVKALKATYGVSITEARISQIKEHLSEMIREAREEHLADLSECRLANSKERIMELEKMYREHEKKPEGTKGRTYWMVEILKQLAVETDFIKGLPVGGKAKKAVELIQALGFGRTDSEDVPEATGHTAAH